jgi:hypothetical protein
MILVKSIEQNCHSVRLMPAAYLPQLQNQTQEMDR